MTNMPTNQQIIDILLTCYDPEIPIDIVNLGLIYNIQIAPINNKTDSEVANITGNETNVPVTYTPENGYKIIITMSLTSAFCPMADVFVNEIRDKLLTLPNVKEVAVEFTFDPPWSLAMVSEEAKLQLNI